MSFQQQIVASAPGRVDIGGRIDIPELFCQFPSGSLSTFNIAIDLRTTVAYSGAPSDAIIVRSGQIEEPGQSDLAPHGSALPYFWMAARECRAPCGTYTIASDIPRSAGLGGSSAFVIALLAVVAAADGRAPISNSDRDHLISRAYKFENETGLTSAGFQDYLAATYGGMNHWQWDCAAGSNIPIAGRQICHTTPLARSFDGSIAVAFTGEAHASNRLPRSQGGLGQEELVGWLRVGLLVSECARLIRECRWLELAGPVMEERELWVRVSGEVMSSRSRLLLRIADELGIAARFAGVPTGGSVWAIGSPEDIARLTSLWTRASSTWAESIVKTVGIDRGLTVVADR